MKRPVNTARYDGEDDDDALRSAAAATRQPLSPFRVLRVPLLFIADVGPIYIGRIFEQAPGGRMRLSLLGFQCQHSTRRRVQLARATARVLLSRATSTSLARKRR